MQQAALAAAAAAVNVDPLAANTAGDPKAGPPPHRKRSVEVLNAAAGQHLDAESASEKVAEKSAAQKLSEQIQEQQNRARESAGGSSAVGQVLDDTVPDHGHDSIVEDGDQGSQESLIHLPQHEQDPAVLPSLQVKVTQQQQQQQQGQPVLPASRVAEQGLSEIELQQQQAAQAALTALT